MTQNEKIFIKTNTIKTNVKYIRYHHWYITDITNLSKRNTS